MRNIFRLLSVPWVGAIILGLTAGPGTSASEAQGTMVFCSDKIYNGCFYSEPAFLGTEYRTTIYFAGCRDIPDTRSYSVQVSHKITFFSEPACTGDSISAPAGYSWKIDTGFTVRSYRY